MTRLETIWDELLGAPDVMRGVTLGRNARALAGRIDRVISYSGIIQSSFLARAWSARARAAACLASRRCA